MAHHCRCLTKCHVHLLLESDVLHQALLVNMNIQPVDKENMSQSELPKTSLLCCGRTRSRCNVLLLRTARLRITRLHNVDILGKIGLLEGLCISVSLAIVFDEMEVLDRIVW